MPSPLSLDLRIRAIEAYERGEGTQVEIAARFGVGEASIRRWWRLRRESGSLEPNTDFRHGPAPLLDEHGLMVLRELLTERPDSTLEELGAGLEERIGVKPSISTLSKVVRDIGWSRKKKAFYAVERDIERIQGLRDAFHDWMVGVDPGRLVFIDEAGSTIAMSREYARAPKGQRASD